MRLTSLLLLTILVACSGGGDSVRQQFLAQASTSVQFDIWVRSLNNQDIDSLALTYHRVPELRVLHSDGAISHGWDVVRERQVEFFESAELVNFVPDGLEIEVLSSEVVLTTFRYTLDSQRVGAERDPTVRGLGSIVWVHDPAADLWKIHLMQLSER